LWLAIPAVCENSKRAATRELRRYAAAQDSSLGTDRAIAALVQNLAGPLKAAKAKNVVVLDLRGPNGGLYPAGKWISDHVSVAMKTQFPKLRIIDRTQLPSSHETPGAPMEESAIFKKRSRKLVRSELTLPSAETSPKYPVRSASR